MMKYIYTLALFVGLASPFLRGQNTIIADATVTSFKADFYKDFTYTDINNGIPDGTPIKLEITKDSWGDNIPVGSYPNNSLIPTEITTKRGTIVLNGNDVDGTIHDFHAMPIKLEYKTGDRAANPGYVRGYGKLNETPSQFKSHKTTEWFLTSGKYGMDLSTGVANIPSNKIEFGSFIVNKEKVGDGKPDFLFTQVAQPASKNDEMYFVNENNKQVGNILYVNFDDDNIPNLGNEKSKRFFEFDPGAAVKPLKIMAFEITDFGISTTEDKSVLNSYRNIKKLVYKPSGDSDPAFVATDRYSVFVYKGISGLIKVAGNEDDIKKKDEVIKIIQDSNANIELVGVSESGQGPFELRYEINGTSDVRTTTITDNKIYLPINTSVLTTYTYKLVSVKDIGTGNTQNIENQELTVKIISPICRNEKPNLTGNAANSKVAISTLNRSGNDISLENLGAYLVLESTQKGFVITRNANPEENIKPAKEGMIVWDTDDNCLKIFNDREGTGVPQWNCIDKVDC